MEPTWLVQLVTASMKLSCHRFAESLLSVWSRRGDRVNYLSARTVNGSATCVLMNSSPALITLI